MRTVYNRKQIASVASTILTTCIIINAYNAVLQCQIVSLAQATINALYANHSDISLNNQFVDLAFIIARLVITPLIALLAILQTIGR